jgi:hypothetical protein
MHWLIELWLIEADPTTFDGLVEARRVAAAFEAVAADAPDRLEIALALGQEFGDTTVRLAPTLSVAGATPARVVVGERVLVPGAVGTTEGGALDVPFHQRLVGATIEAWRDPGCRGLSLGLRLEGEALRPTRDAGWLPGGPGVDVAWSGCTPEGWAVHRPAPHLVLVTRARPADEDAPGALRANDVARRLDALAPFLGRGVGARRRAAERLLGLRGREPLLVWTLRGPGEHLSHGPIAEPAFRAPLPGGAHLVGTSRAGGSRCFEVALPDASRLDFGCFPEGHTFDAASQSLEFDDGSVISLHIGHPAAR